jgi:hypothetical protein
LSKLPFFTILPLPSLEKVCGKLLIRSILLLLFSFEAPGKNQKNTAKKKKQKRQKKEEDRIKGALCVFSFLLCSGAL